MLNHIVLMGRLTRDPELRRTGSGIAVASFTLAVDRDFKSQNGEKEFHRRGCLEKHRRVRLQILHQGQHGGGIRQTSNSGMDR